MRRLEFIKRFAVGVMASGMLADALVRVQPPATVVYPLGSVQGSHASRLWQSANEQMRELASDLAAFDNPPIEDIIAAIRPM